MHAESISNTTVRVHVKNPMRCDESDEISIYLLPLLSFDVLDGMNYMLHNYIYDAQLPMRRPHTATMETNKDNVTTTTTTRNVRSTAATTTTSTPTARMKFSRSERGGGVTNRDEERDRAREGFVVLNGWANLFMTMALGKPSTRRTPWSMEPGNPAKNGGREQLCRGVLLLLCALVQRRRKDGQSITPKYMSLRITEKTHKKASFCLFPTNQ